MHDEIPEIKYYMHNGREPFQVTVKRQETFQKQLYLNSFLWLHQWREWQLKANTLFGTMRNEWEKFWEILITFFNSLKLERFEGRVE